MHFSSVRRAMPQQPTEADFLILLVEDEESDAIALQRALRRHGVKSPVRWVKDGLEALDYLQDENNQTSPGKLRSNSTGSFAVLGF